mgnify:CR=1 FL=1
MHGNDIKAEGCTVELSPYTVADLEASKLAFLALYELSPPP